jgi:diadenosine tetraphosphatase ApaH/serine/threonine PP2A family protein phosphatase
MSKLIQLDRRKLRSFRTFSVIGDLHGDFEAFQVALKIVDPLKDAIVFLGDYADRGPSGVEVIDAVNSLKRNYPQNVFALKGNHEDYTEAGQPEFWPCTLIDEVQNKGKDWQRYFQNVFKPFILSLPLAMLVQGEILFVHGGISTKIRDIGDLKNPKRNVELDILWSDPIEGDGERPNWERGGAGVVFGQDVTESLCKLLEVRRIVRSHQPAKALTGPFYSHKGRVITISSTSVYGGQPFMLNIDPVDLSNLRFTNLSPPDNVSEIVP